MEEFHKLGKELQEQVMEYLEEFSLYEEVNLYTNHPITINFFDIEEHLKRVKEKILHTKIMDPVLELFD